MSGNDHPDGLKSEKAMLEVEKLREDVKKARRENRIWVIGLLLTVAGFGLGNLNTIKDLMTGQPQIRLVVEDAFVKRVGMVRVAHTSGSRDVAVEASVSEAEEWLPLSPGSYEITVFVEEKPYYSRTLLLKNGDSEPIVVPERDTGSIRLLVKNHTPDPKPDTALDLSIESSGNGFLWVYDVGKDGDFSLVYPDPAKPAAVAEIAAGRTYTIPDADGTHIRTDREVGQERLLFVVTSSPAVGDAQNIVARMSKAVTPKARTESESANWGIARLQYDVSW